MPRYELSLILRVLDRSETIAAMRRVGEAIIERGGLIRAIENLGEKNLPFKMISHSQGYRSGRYIIMEFEGKPTIVKSMREYLRRDVDVIRPGVLKLDPYKKTRPECDGPEQSTVQRSLSDAS
ncbi:small ribosomal subunit protein bS6m-like [Ptychodera flava]|uniref:small ribosomal subunit protein bS6m-like n=1 Tax=Ptychodera flava TaxID=63121 RepID=UPI003969CB1F